MGGATAALGWILSVDSQGSWILRDHVFNSALLKLKMWLTFVSSASLEWECLLFILVLLTCLVLSRLGMPLCGKDV